jgi:hypothetical protein
MENNLDKQLLTLSTCWYNLKSKFPSEQYLLWIQNFFSIVNNFNLVLYTDKNGVMELHHILHKYNHILNIKIKIIIKSITDFYGYKYKDQWIKNHNRNTNTINLHKHIDWELNMLWCEKVHFVKETIDNKYFDTPFYGWCDIGYFRNKPDTTNTRELINGHWPKLTRNKLFPTAKSVTQIHYACVQNNEVLFNRLRNETKEGKQTLINSPCFAGGFFILSPTMVTQYVQIFDEKLNYYFSNGYLVKDDQTIVKDCIFSNPDVFCIHFENTMYDNWFMFQRILL